MAGQEAQNCALHKKYSIMANKLKEQKTEQPERKAPSPKKASNGRANKIAKSFFSGDFLFSGNFRRSPIWFILYCVLLILIYIGMRYEPVKRYNTMVRLNKELDKCNYRNNDVKAQLQKYQSSSVLTKQLSPQGFQHTLEQPHVIIVEKNGRH